VKTARKMTPEKRCRKGVVNKGRSRSLPQSGFRQNELPPDFREKSLSGDKRGALAHLIKRTGIASGGRSSCIFQGGSEIGRGKHTRFCGEAAQARERKRGRKKGDLLHQEASRRGVRGGKEEGGC